MHANKIVLLLLILFAAMSQNAKIIEPENEIDLLSLQKLLPTGELTLFDVREPQELQTKGEIPGAVNIPFSQVEQAFQLPANIFQMKYQIEKPETTSGMVLFCVSGRRATLAQAILKQMGYQKVQVYVGGFPDWIKAGGSIFIAKSHPNSSAKTY